MRDGVLIFHSIHKVMKAEKILKDNGVEVKLMPVPRSLSSDCGLSLEFPLSVNEKVKGFLEEQACIPEEIYEKKGEGKYTQLV